MKGVEKMCFFSIENWLYLRHGDW